MKKKDWKYRSKTERQFEGTLTKTSEYIAEATQHARTLEEIIAVLTSISKQPWYQEFARKEAVKMVRSVAVENARTWRQAARKSQRSREIHQLLKAEFEHNKRFYELVQRNAGFIQSLPEDIAKHATQRAAKQAIAGLRGSELVQQIQADVPHIAESRAKLIARTEVAKTQAVITQVRAEAIGIEYYVWRTSEDGRVRSSHKHMNGVICSYQEPPSPEVLDGQKSQGSYGPGEIYNCRCYAEPIIDVSFLSFPVKFHQAGTIQRISKKRFIEVAAA